MEGYKQPYYHFCSQKGDVPYVHVPYDESYANEEAHLSKSFGSCKPVCLTPVCKNTTAVEIFSSVLGSMTRKIFMCVLKCPSSLIQENDKVAPKPTT